MKIRNSNNTRATLLRLVDSILGEEANLKVLIQTGTSQNIANTAWSCATLRVECPLLFEAIGTTALPRLRKGTLQHISSTAWACATLRVECPSLFEAIDNDASSSYFGAIETGLDVQAIATIAWACAALQVQCPSFFQAIENHASSLIEKGTSQDIAKIALACKTLGVPFDCPSLLLQAMKNDNQLLVPR